MFTARGGHRLLALRVLLAVVLTLSLMACAGPKSEQAKQPEATGPVTLNFTSWTYDLNKVKDNLKRFEEWTRSRDDLVDATVQLSDFGFGNYETALTTRFMSGANVHVLYGSDAWLSKWAKAGFVVPIEELDPRFKEYASDMEDYVRQGLLYEGKLYGLPYYADHMQFVYNEKMLKAAGFTAPPSSWEELVDQAKVMISKGVAPQPIFMPLSSSPWLDETFYALVYSRGGHLFDDKGDPAFGAEPGGPVYESLKWVVDALSSGIIPKAVLNMQAVDVQEVFKQGGAAFVIVPSYMLAEFQAAGISKVAGDARITLMPGSSHGTTGFSRSVLVGQAAKKAGGNVLKAALQLVEFLGGKVEIGGVTAYHIPKRWTVENGLGFGYKSMWDDQQVKDRLSQICDVEILKQQKGLARTKEGMEYPWYAEWITYFRGELQKAFMGQKAPEQALADSAAEWNKLKAEFTK